MKQALILLHNHLTANGLAIGREYAFVANIHDEFKPRCYLTIAKAMEHALSGRFKRREKY